MIMALVAGLLFPLAFAPFNQSGLSILSLSIWFYLLEKSSKKHSVTLSFIYGLGKYGLGMSWVYVSISTFSELPMIFSALITFGFVSFLSLYEALFGYIYKSLIKNKSNFIRCLIFSSLGALIEMLRSRLFTGLPWLLAGHSQLLTPLAKLAPVIGSIGLSYICYLLAAFLCNALKLEQNRRVKNYVYAFMCLLPFILCDQMLTKPWTTAVGQPLKVSLIQGNISHEMKWSDEQFDKTLNTYQKLTQLRLQDDLIVWPETALPMPSFYAVDIFAQLRKSANKHHSAIILGAPGMNDDDTLSNSMFLLGKNTGRYDKQHLVPFGEYMPIASFHPLYHWFNIPFANLNQGTHAKDLFEIKKLVISPFICFEIAFDSKHNLDRISKSNMILTLTDDSWFGHSIAKAQHLQIAQMMSLETGRTQLFASNDGLTAFINEKGRISKILPPYRQGYLHHTITGHKGNTPFMTHGNTPLLSTIIGTFILLLLL